MIFFFFQITYDSRVSYTSFGHNTNIFVFYRLQYETSLHHILIKLIIYVIYFIK